MPLKTTVIGAWPKPEYLKLGDWFENGPSEKRFHISLIKTYLCSKKQFQNKAKYCNIGDEKSCQNHLCLL